LSVFVLHGSRPRFGQSSDLMSDCRSDQDPGVVPNSVRFELGGAYAQQQIAFRGLAAVFGAALAPVFVLLLFLYESFATAIAILMMPLLAVCAVFIGLWVTGIELNMTAMMGMTMIVGIVTEVAIFFFSEFLRFIPLGTSPEAQRRTASARTCSSPTALACGESATFWIPIPRIGGRSCRAPSRSQRR
jgi:hypothetical protein